jgi:hypothetical protein
MNLNEVKMVLKGKIVQVFNMELIYTNE